MTIWKKISEMEQHFYLSALPWQNLKTLQAGKKIHLLYRKTQSQNDFLRVDMKLSATGQISETQSIEVFETLCCRSLRFSSEQKLLYPAFHWFTITGWILYFNKTYCYILDKSLTILYTNLWNSIATINFTLVFISRSFFPARTNLFNWIV